MAADIPPASAYEKLWARVAPFYQQDVSAMPAQTEWVPHEPYAADQGDTGRPYASYTPGVGVSLSPRGERGISTTAKSVGVKPGSPRGQTIMGRRETAMRALFHEWAHAFQTPEMLATYPDRELDANKTAGRVVRQLRQVRRAR